MGAPSGKGKRKRTPKTSKGLRKAKRHPLTVLEKALMGKGIFASCKHVECHNNWRGSTSVREPWDKAQARINTEAGLCG